MKTISIFTFLCLYVLSCKGQEPKNAVQKTDTLMPKTKSMYYIPNVNSSFEKFDFQKDKEKYTKTSLIYSSNNEEYLGTSYDFEEKIDDKTIIKYYGLLKNGKIITPYETTFYNNSPFATRKTFYPNGNIKEKGLYIVSGNFHKGIWYHFDESGKLTHTIDNDKIFGFSWEQVEKFMEENKIPMPLGDAYIHGKTEIYRSSPLLYPQSSVTDPIFKSDKKLWSITWNGGEFNLYYNVVLEGDSGKMLTRKKYWVKDEPGDHVPDPIIEDFTAVYKTHEGKNYTKAEWEAYEEKQYEEYCKRTGKLYNSSHQDKIAENQDNKSKFIADNDEKGDEDIPKKKKGFWR